MAIKLLDPQVANQIAAGEVVEGASSVIKELVENSIDANAKRINIELSNQFRRIRIADNGSGMSSEDIDLAFKRHSTSKIDTIDDIYHISTNGFRGEALASIASVSKLTCISKRYQDEHASKLYLESGTEQKTLTGAAVGTSILVDDLFFNTPARLKFLKSNNKERNTAIDLIRSFAISHPEISFTLNIDNKVVLKSSGCNKLEQTIKEIFSIDVAESLYELKFNNGDLKVSGFISAPHLTRSDKRGIFTILNQRILRCPVMKSALDMAYKDILLSGKNPIAVINVEMPYSEVDVNVHPSKKEVKYHDANLVHQAVGDAIHSGLTEGFYQQQQNYQTRIDDQRIAQEHEAQNNLASTEVKQEALSIEPETNKEVFQSSKSQITTIDLEQRSRANTEDLTNTEEEFETDEPKLEKLDSSAHKKFLGRISSLDISSIDDNKLQSQASTHGNRTSFEIVVKTPDDSTQVKSILLRGEFVGDNWIKEKYLAFVNELGQELLERELSKTTTSHKTKNTNRPDKKVSMADLEEIWERDNYTCVYCKKALLHPSTVKNSLRKLEEGAYRTQLGTDGEKVTYNILNEHVATYDHHLPASKFTPLNTHKENLYASCFDCNKQKSDSLASKTWTPKRMNAWESPVIIAGLEFESPD